MYLRRNETNFRVLSKTTAHGSVPCVKKDRPAQLKREWSLAASLSPSQRELSQHLKYIVRDRISEFESSHPSHGVEDHSEQMSLLMRRVPWNWVWQIRPCAPKRSASSRVNGGMPPRQGVHVFSARVSVMYASPS